VWHIGERGNAHRASVRKLEGKRSLGIPGSRWEDREIEWESVPGLLWLTIGIIGGVQFSKIRGISFLAEEL
jgi:hypothetical protein